VTAKARQLYYGCK